MLWNDSRHVDWTNVAHIAPARRLQRIVDPSLISPCVAPILRLIDPGGGFPMRCPRFAALCAVGAAAVSLVGAGESVAQGNVSPAPSPQERADRIQAEVAEIRGLPFKRSVRAENQSLEAAAQYMDRQLENSVPPQLAEHFSEIVRKLGLYRGAEDLDFREMMKAFAASQIAAYYDPKQEAFFVVFADLSAGETGAVYAHELYHGLQDQYFDLDSYVLDQQRDRTLNDDELFARAAVIEGEATLLMTLWSWKSTLGNLPSRPVLAQVVRLQSQVDTRAMLQTLDQPGASAFLSEDIKASIAAMERIPRFLMESMLGSYLHGMSFVFEVQGGGWSEVEKLYNEAPPVSTEQILHPEKWLAREAPLEIELPAFAGNPLFAGWDVLEQNVLGEVQWRIVFAELGLAAEANEVAAGWNGDRYAVLKRRGSDDLLLLLYTSWDSDADAAEFAAAYRRALVVKYAGLDEPTRVAHNGRDVLIVEGGAQSSLAAMVDFVRSAKRTPPRRPAP
jgi:hypothetical protein